MEEQSYVLSYDIWDFAISSHMFQKLFDSAIFLCNCAVERILTLLAGVFGPHGGSDSLLLWSKTALRVIMTTVIMIKNNVHKLCYFFFNFVDSQLTSPCCDCYELQVPWAQLYSVLCAVRRDDGICDLFFPRQTPIKANLYSLRKLFWCLAVSL